MDSTTDTIGDRVTTPPRDEDADFRNSILAAAIGLTSLGGPGSNSGGGAKESVTIAPPQEDDDDKGSVGSKLPTAPSLPYPDEANEHAHQLPPSSSASSAPSWYTQDVNSQRDAQRSIHQGTSTSAAREGTMGQLADIRQDEMMSRYPNLFPSNNNNSSSQNNPEMTPMQLPPKRQKVNQRSWTPADLDNGASRDNNGGRSARDPLPRSSSPGSFPSSQNNQGGGAGSSSNPGSMSITLNFPEILYEIISNAADNKPIISWLPHGNGFTIHDKETFASKILPNHFDGAKFTSFTRRLKRWNFERVSKGPEMGAYYNKCFMRDRPDLVGSMMYGVEDGGMLVDGAALGPEDDRGVEDDFVKGEEGPTAQHNEPGEVQRLPSNGSAASSGSKGKETTTKKARVKKYTVLPSEKRPKPARKYRKRGTAEDDAVVAAAMEVHRAQRRAQEDMEASVLAEAARAKGGNQEGTARQDLPSVAEEEVDFRNGRAAVQEQRARQCQEQGGSSSPRAAPTAPQASDYSLSAKAYHRGMGLQDELHRQQKPSNSKSQSPQAIGRPKGSYRKTPNGALHTSKPGYKEPTKKEKRIQKEALERKKKFDAEKLKMERERLLAENNRALLLKREGLRLEALQQRQDQHRHIDQRERLEQHRIEQREQLEALQRQAQDPHHQRPFDQSRERLMEEHRQILLREEILRQKQQELQEYSRPSEDRSSVVSMSNTYDRPDHRARLELEARHAARPRSGSRGSLAEMEALQSHNELQSMARRHMEMTAEMEQMAMLHRRRRNLSVASAEQRLDAFEGRNSNGRSSQGSSFQGRNSGLSHNSFPGAVAGRTLTRNNHHDLPIISPPEGEHQQASQARLNEIQKQVLSEMKFPNLPVHQRAAAGDGRPSSASGSNNGGARDMSPFTRHEMQANNSRFVTNQKLIHKIMASSKTHEEIMMMAAQGLQSRGIGGDQGGGMAAAQRQSQNHYNDVQHQSQNHYNDGQEQRMPVSPRRLLQERHAEQRHSEIMMLAAQDLRERMAANRQQQHQHQHYPHDEMEQRHRAARDFNNMHLDNMQSMAMGQRHLSQHEISPHLHRPQAQQQIGQYVPMSPSRTRYHDRMLRELEEKVEMETASQVALGNPDPCDRRNSRASAA